MLDNKSMQEAQRKRDDNEVAIQKLTMESQDQILQRCDADNSNILLHLRSVYAIIRVDRLTNVNYEWIVNALANGINLGKEVYLSHLWYLIDPASLAVLFSKLPDCKQLKLFVDLERKINDKGSARLLGFFMIHNFFDRNIQPTESYPAQSLSSVQVRFLIELYNGVYYWQDKRSVGSLLHSYGLPKTRSSLGIFLGLENEST